MLNFINLHSNATTVALNASLFDLDLQTGQPVLVALGSLDAYPTQQMQVSMDGQLAPGQPVTHINNAQIRAFARFFGHQNSYTQATYRNVKGHAVWRAVYGVIPAYPFRTLTPQGVMGNRFEDGASCSGCLIFMPLRCLSIDHQRPQVGGQIAAVFRVFRALGLTTAGPLGHKGQQAIQANAAAVGGVVAPPGPQNAPAPRYQLNLPGMMYYTLLIEDANVWADAQAKAMHHYMNLRPMCGPCNSRLGNQNALVF